MWWTQLSLAAVPLAWLVPNHFFPWLSAWQEGLALFLLFAAATVSQQFVAPNRLWQWLIGLIAASVSAQLVTGRIIYFGDALMVLLYVTAFALSLGLGGALTGGRDQPASGLTAFATGAVLSAVLSVGVALVQWTGAFSLGHFGVNLAAGARPFANVAQANHFSTLCFWALCCLLILFERRNTGKVVTAICAVFLIFGMTMSASRTGWLQVALLVFVAIACRTRAATRLSATGAVSLALVYGLLTASWPSMNDGLFLSGGRAVTEQIQGGVRLPLWISLVDAAWREPWWGYGWQQVGLAQQMVATDHPPLRHYFQHSHNLALDLLLWAGIPIGGLLIVTGAYALFRAARSLNDARAFWLLAAVLGVLVHAMLEFPLEYAYFLIPTGLAIGALTALSPSYRFHTLRARTGRMVGCIGLLVSIFIAHEYIQAENSYRLLRLESARIGTTRIESKAPNLLLLTQLKAFANFARADPRQGMTKEEIRAMRDVARRYGYATVLFRYATVAGLNGLPAEAAEALAVLCRLNTQKTCDESRAAWAALQGRYPALQEIPSH